MKHCEINRETYIRSPVILGELEKGWPFCVVGLAGFAFEEVYHAEAVPGNKEKTYSIWA